MSKKVLQITEQMCKRFFEESKMYKETVTKIKAWFNDEDRVQEENGVLSFVAYIRHGFPEYKIYPVYPTDFMTISGEINLGVAQEIVEEAAYRGCVGYEFVISGTRDITGPLVDEILPDEEENDTPCA